MDRTQIDKIYVLAKIIDSKGLENMVFLGAAEQSSRGGADGLFDAVNVAISKTVEKDLRVTIFHTMSSLVTDGASINIRHKSGLWAHFDKLESNIPKLKVWCVVHRMQLAWK